MKSRKRLLGLVVLVIAVVSVASACGSAATEPTSGESATLDGETLLEERCTECHGLERATSAQKTRAEWDSTVSRMISKGAQLSDEEKTVLLDYLEENYGS